VLDAHRPARAAHGTGKWDTGEERAVPESDWEHGEARGEGTSRGRHGRLRGRTTNSRMPGVRQISALLDAVECGRQRHGVAVSSRERLVERGQWRVASGRRARSQYLACPGRPWSREGGRRG
jgi:hypothetical protein